MSHNLWVLSRFVHILVIHFGCIAATIKNQNWGFRDQVFSSFNNCNENQEILFKNEEIQSGRMVWLIFDDHAVISKIAVSGHFYEKSGNRFCNIRNVMKLNFYFLAILNSMLTPLFDIL